VSGSDRARTSLMEYVETTAETLAERAFFAEVADRVIVVHAAFGRVRERTLAAIQDGDHRLTCGESGAVRLADLERAKTDAEQALEAGLRLGHRHTTFTDIAGFELIDLLATPPVAAFAQSLLRPLIEHDATSRGELLRSLRVWLEHNGQWDAAAAELRVHRHTLRHRMHRVHELLGRDLDIAAVRVELWTGLQVLQLRRLENVTAGAGG
jgi:purine catabolism regulator